MNCRKCGAVFEQKTPHHFYCGLACFAAHRMHILTGRQRAAKVTHIRGESLVNMQRKP